MQRVPQSYFADRLLLYSCAMFMGQNTLEFSQITADGKAIKIPADVVYKNLKKVITIGFAMGVHFHKTIS